MNIINSIVLNNLSKSFGTKEVLKKISLEITEGEIFGLLGPSGAGKTTIIKILTGQISYDGAAKILNSNCRSITREAYDKIGMMTDNCGLYDRLSCFDNMKIYAKIHKVDNETILNILNRVGLKDKKTLAGKMSKGMRQRLILARAILHSPSLLFLDEPTSGLDPATATEIHSLLIELKKSGTTIFLTTHNMEEAYKLCDHIALLNDGKIVEYGIPENVCRKYNTKKTLSILFTDGKKLTMSAEPENSAIIAEYFSLGSIETIHSSEPTLETVFMALTGKELNV